MSALGVFRPGVHTMTYINANTSVGLTTGDGIRLRWRFSEAKINNTSAYADTLIDGVFRGVNAQLLFTVKETNAAVQAMLWPWSNATPTIDGALGVIGQLASAVSKSLVLTPQTNSPAYTNPMAGTGNGILTCGLVKLAPDNDLEMLFGPVETDVPVLLDLLLYDDSGTKRLFKWS